MGNGESLGIFNFVWTMKIVRFGYLLLTFHKQKLLLLCEKYHIFWNDFNFKCFKSKSEGLETKIKPYFLGNIVLDNIVQSGILMCSVVWRWSRDWKLEALPKITIGFALVEYLNHECREFKFSGSKPLIYIIAWLEFKSITQFSPIIFYITCLFFQTKNH